jgi:hypothetical protein
MNFAVRYTCQDIQVATGATKLFFVITGVSVITICGDN